MQLSQIPAKIAAIFAASAPPTSKNTIPLTQAGTTQPGQASFDVGFPSVTMQPASSGGVNPYGQDFNGILSAVTGVQRWQNAGAGFPYDATFSASIGGYPAGTQLVRSDGMGYWLNQTDNNTNNPDTGGAGWIPFAPGWTNGIDTGAVNACVVNFTPGIVALTDNMVLWFKAKASNTGATTLNVNGLGAAPVLGLAHSALQGGEIIANGRCLVVWNATLGAWVLVACSGGALQVGLGTQGQHAVNLGQSFGVGQTLQNVLGSRSWNTMYTNSTGRSIFVNVAGSVGTLGAATQITVAGVAVVGTSDFTGGNSSYISSACAIVPNGATYFASVTTGAVGVLYSWTELR